MSKIIEMSARKGKDYSKVMSSSGHGQFSIEDEEDDNVEISFDGSNGDGGDDQSGRTESFSPFSRAPTEDKGLILNAYNWICHIWSVLTFSWMQKLLQTGNERPLEMEDLYKLAYEDTAEGVYRKFKKGWLQEITEKESPSLAMAFFHAFGTPFLMAAFLKLIHDSALFVGPQLLNKLIDFLNDPSIPLETGLWYVFGLFISNLVMSLCLRQYFWSCYRVGMNLKSSVVTSIYNKALDISVAALSRKTLGEITNLMSVDSSRLQDLTPYLHAVWYSLYQIAVALFFLYRQMGISCFAGMILIIVTIPLTKQVSMHLKTLQKALSTVRDERIKLTNEVLTGMKVIKLQAWEIEFENRIKDVRERELEIFKKYSIAVSLSGALYTAIPLMVAILTFTSYIGLGNTLDVATALTSLALFDLLRFPLFMLPTVLNNLVEAKVSVDRVQGFLLEAEKKPVSAYPLKKTGALMQRATLVWEAGVKRKVDMDSMMRNKLPKKSLLQHGLAAVKDCSNRVLVTITCGRLGHSMPSTTVNNQLSPTANPMLNRANSNTSLVSTTSTVATAGGAKKVASSAPPLNEEEFLSIVLEAHVVEAERIITDLENELALYRNTSSTTATEVAQPLLHTATSFVDRDALLHEGEEVHRVEDTAVISFDQTNNTSRSSSPMPTGTGKDARILTLSHINLQARAGQLISVVGPVGSGKSSLLSALLGDMRCCFGSVSVYGSIAYTSQVAFIQNSTLKENIIYGNPYDEALYQQTLRVCALLQDIEVLPAGHETEIGERGINLSGGQKARVGLARAVYSNADIYLLDDPLSAVDAHVGQHLFEECILDLKRRGKCVILVTNALQFLKQSSSIIVLKDGRISECGDYDQLLKNKRGFTEMIATMQETSSSTATGDETEQEGLVHPEDLADVTIDHNETNDLTTTAVDTDNKSAAAMKARARSISSSTAAAAGGKKHTDSNTAAAEIDAKVNMKKAANLIVTEDREVGNVSMEVYGKWAIAAGGISVGIMIILLFFAGEGITVLSSWWLSYWSEHRYSGSPWYYLGIYIVINCAVVICALCRELYVRLRALNAGRSLFIELLSSVLFSPMSFFDTTPLGRIINRFSKDIYTIDEQIPQTFRSYLGTMAKVISTILYICIITPLFMLGLIPIMGFYYIAQRYYIKTSRELTRLESTSRSPIYALFSETLDGLATIRAYNCEKRLIAKNNYLLDSNVQSYFLNFSANCWLAVRLEFAGTLIVTFTALFAVLGRSSTTSDDATNGPVDSDHQRQVFAGMAGLAISFALSVTQSLNWTVRMASDMESQMVSVERVKTYAMMPQEAAHFLPEDPLTVHTPPDQRHMHHQFRGPPGAGGATWPTQGAIEMRNVHMRYRDGLPLVLRGLNLSISAKAKVGIVGRTGAGKSSLLTALLRLVELDSGSIFIDKVDTSKIGLNTLRSVMAVIPQDPVLFSGTIRSNLDPFNKYNDIEIWEGLSRTLLSNTISSLDDKVTENGSNFSVGQRQLLCIARALLSKAKIIIMDEATAAVDVETDAVIQQTIRTEFAHATCLTVAHRLNTIMDSDKVLVMDNGIAAEYDTPENLLSDENSMFYALQILDTKSGFVVVTSEKSAKLSKIDRIEADIDATKVEAKTQHSVAPDEINYKNFPLYFDVLKRVGLQTPDEQYMLYASLGIFIYGSYTPARKAFFLNRWLHETDPSLKDIWAARANLSPLEQKGGERYVQELRKVPKRYAVIPLSFLLIEGIRSGYRKLSSIFPSKN